MWNRYPLDFATFYSEIGFLLKNGAYVLIIYIIDKFITWEHELYVFINNLNSQKTRLIAYNW